MPNFRTFKKIPIPAVDPKQPGAKTTTLVIELDPLSKTNERVSARIDHRLYKRGADGKFVSAMKSEKPQFQFSSGIDRKTFRNVPRPVPGSPPDELYAAVETSGVSADGPSLSEFVDHIDVIVRLPDIAVQFQDPPRAEYLSSDSTPDVKLIKLIAPTEIQDESTPSKTRASNATLKVETGDPNAPEITVNLPVTLTDRPRPTSGRPIERARGTLIIRTDQARISASIPVIFLQ